MDWQEPQKEIPFPRRLWQRFRQLSWIRKLSLFLILIGILLLSYYFCVNYLPKLRRQQAINENLDIVNVDAMNLVPITQQTEEIYAHYEYPTDSMFVTDDRKSFSDGDMWLTVPRLGYDGPVLDGTSDWVLQRGPGLYQYSPLPSYGNPNVSIAGHRGIYGAEFYNIDSFEEGDLMILWYDGYQFVYRYQKTEIVPMTDWNLIYCSQNNTLTLTSCDMDNTVDRWVVVGELVSVTRAQEGDPCYTEVSRHGKLE